MQCPKCQSTMHAMDTHEAVELDFCSGCKGIWFDAREASAYFEMADDLPQLKAALEGATQTDLACPRCNFALNEVRFHRDFDVMIDFCMQCGGLFFDKGEVPAVEKIAASLHHPHSKVMMAMAHLERQGYEVVGVKIPNK